MRLPPGAWMLSITVLEKSPTLQDGGLVLARALGRKLHLARSSETSVPFHFMHYARSPSAQSSRSLLS
ncbi:hypothetical protein NDU88_000553 [Pleurodeles waltl]|uniref:Uncharacterized protein n=1 Tax=Pleurodeles waltl TaxID=8319 RepID=A0AAV7U3V3_PLEWA|nr:hypothetical protein NDU88_000553 [Pleurodeles waltl]